MKMNKKSNLEIKPGKNILKKDYKKIHARMKNPARDVYKRKVPWQ
jgi:hypothetical protein